MPRQCTYDYKIKVSEKFVRHELLCYKPRKRTLPLDKHAYGLHMRIMWEERQRAKESTQTLFTKRYPLAEMDWTRAECYTYNKVSLDPLLDSMGSKTVKISLCLDVFCIESTPPYFSTDRRTLERPSP